MAGKPKFQENFDKLRNCWSSRKSPQFIQIFYLSCILFANILTFIVLIKSTRKYMVIENHVGAFLKVSIFQNF